MEPLHPTDPPRIGPYHLTARLGVGGMGQIYLAHTTSGRQLVVKVIRPELAALEGFRARFAREADAARLVGGFHTAQVVDADPGAEAPWIATAHIPGPTLDQAVRDQRPITPPALHVLATGLAEGLKAIHACGLVHRDLKPGNIILAHDGPRIIDFGIARPLDADSMTTQGAVFGTLPYMSPEQTDGSRVGPASDMFSLGTVLTYAATGTNPFNGATMAETLRRLISPPPDPGNLDKDVRALVLECWNHDPGQRPTPEQTLARFEAHDLRNAWPPPHTPRTKPATALPPAVPVSASAESTQSLSPSIFASETELISAPQHTKVQDPPQVPAKESSLQPIPMVGGDPGSYRRGSGQKGSVYISAAITMVAVLSLLRENSPEPNTISLTGHEGSVRSVAFSPDGTTLATGSNDDTVRLWNVDTGETTTTLTGHEGSVESVVFSPDGTTLATLNNGEANPNEIHFDDDTVRLWDTDTGEPTILTAQEFTVQSVAFSPDGTTLATGGFDHESDDATVQLWDVDTGELITTLTGQDDWVQSVAFSPDGTTLATGSYDGVVRMLDTDTGETTILTTDGSGANGTVRLWDTDTGETTATPTVHEGSVDTLAFGPDGATLATGSADGTVRLWDTDTGETTATLNVDGSIVSSVAFSPDGTTLATGSSADYGNDHRTGAVQLWDTGTGEITRTLTEGNVQSVAFSPDGATLATGISDDAARLWDLG